MKSERFECQCSSFQHSVRFSLDEADGSLFMEIGLNPLLPWYRRIPRALGYLFFPGSSRYGEHDEVILRNEDRGRLMKLLQRSADLNSHPLAFKVPRGNFEMEGK